MNYSGPTSPLRLNCGSLRASLLQTTKQLMSPSSLRIEGTRAAEGYDDNDGMEAREVCCWTRLLTSVSDLSDRATRLVGFLLTTMCFATVLQTIIEAKK
ncbi:uncharacterized protein BO97DRAFT_220274 [Aspergillus homomorphus CBS 101889]|uniref:Uncharacterized protein n=1 Tax=Aspergillus homomorphus (strain CBS 101889) TaxID=1450537 RepID=A0A395I632_ASPHC|nr:hypothetical protein BO97DRAFT_220274 [Aspergillus homomorphus CBS 101889]RAL15681.1 hypothetical protein BO97DRAFT_220274 [Aspergillus homomorphus CBS 101889]